MKRLLLVLSLVIAPGCGGAIAHRRPDPLPADQARELDALEESLAHEQEVLDGLDPLACPERCHSVEGICEASERICEIAGELGDEGVNARCARASHACDEARGESSGCACAASTGDVAARDASPML